MSLWLLSLALAAPSELDQLRRGDPAPALDFVHEGETVTLDAAQGPVVVDFWTTWCAPCLMMMPDLKQVARDNPDLTVYSVCLDADEEERKARRISGDNPDNMLFVEATPDTRAAYEEIMGGKAAISVPGTYFVTTDERFFLGHKGGGPEMYSWFEDTLFRMRKWTLRQRKKAARKAAREAAREAR